MTGDRPFHSWQGRSPEPVKVDGKIYRVWPDATGTKAIRIDVQTRAWPQRFRILWKWGPKSARTSKVERLWQQADQDQPRLI